jgi:UPF0755 protein
MVRRRSKSRKKTGCAWAAVLLLLFVTVSGLAGMAAWSVLTPFGPDSEVLVDLAPGSSTVRIGRNLEDAGVVRSRFAFDLLRFFLRGKLQAGEYRFDHPAPVTEVYSRIVHGDVFTRPVVVTEGANIYDIAARVEQAHLATRQDFLDAARSQTALVADIDPGAQSLEGYLFPDTYRFPHNATPVQIVAAMVRRFRQSAAQIGLQQDFHRTVTLASLVERETAVDADRPLVASVFTNRLAKNMPLETDPSVIYGLILAGRWQGVIYRSDLAGDTPYNTYLHAGLPPGPIANPGLRSLRAALSPAQSSYLYFVAAGTNAQGYSRFSTTLDEHNHNVAGYRRALKKAGLR